MTKSKFLFKFYYIGTHKYYGSQRQGNILTIENTILKALENRNYIHKLKDGDFEFASRTDRFVSARGACFTCITQKEPILMEINSSLPREIGIWAYTEVPLEFSSRYNAIFRHYIYIVSTPMSYLQKTSNINVDIMKKACKQIEGRHDFVNFFKSEGNLIKSIRDMDSATLSIQDDYLIFQFKSRSFLRQQVRRMVKKILELGKNEISYDDFLDLFDKSKEISYQPADSKGLILWDVRFDDRIKFIEDQKSIERRNNFFLTKEIDFGLRHQLFRALQQDNFC